jgi:hypothetical protein
LANEFPWKHPAGRFDSNHSRKFVWPPNAEPIRRGVKTFPPLPRHQRNDQRPDWQWPVGTTVFEWHHHPGGWPFALRVLEKTKNGNGFDNYEARIFRPYQEEADLPVRPRLKDVQHVEIRSRHTRRPFLFRGKVHVYEDIKIHWKGLVMLTTWRDDTGHDWHHRGAGDSWLTPRDYAGWIAGSSHESCAVCHDTAGEPVVYFEPFREWYSTISGADGLFSLHPGNAKP